MPATDPEIEQRLALAKSVATQAGQLAHEFFQSLGELVIESKGVQDMVSNADLEVESFVRQKLSEAFPQDGIVGEEHANVESQSGYTWVIDPIDGTANFVAGIPAWCVILACVHDDKTKVAAIYEPCHDELFWAATGTGAFLNDQAINVSQTSGLNIGNTGVGMNGRTASELVTTFVALLAEKGGLFYRNASGGLMLAYVAAGRLIAYAEPHMNAWDCLAGQLLVAEAGGCIETQSADQMLIDGGRVVTSGPIIFDELIEMADAAFNQ